MRPIKILASALLFAAPDEEYQSASATNER
jgi:hypothetical protein